MLALPGCVARGGPTAFCRTTSIPIEKDRAMAAHGNPEYAIADGNDYAAHEQTYENFLSLVKWGLTCVIIIVIGMAYFLV
jgi:hypothetical protein